MKILLSKYSLWISHNPGPERETRNSSPWQIALYQSWGKSAFCGRTRKILHSARDKEKEGSDFVSFSSEPIDNILDTLRKSSAAAEHVVLTSLRASLESGIEEWISGEYATYSS